MAKEAFSPSLPGTAGNDGIPSGDRMRLAFERAQMRKSEVCGLAIRIDRFDTWRRRGGVSDLVTRLKALCERLGEESAAHAPALVQLEAEGLFALFQRTPPELGQELARRLVAEAREVQVGPGRQRPTVSIGLAHNRQRDPIFFETLCEVAARGAEVAAQAGGDRVSQTDLYGLVQRRSERSGDALAEQTRMRRDYGLSLDDSPVFEAAEKASGPVEPRGLPAPGTVDPQAAAEAAIALAEERKRLRIEFEQATLRELDALEKAKKAEHSQDVERLERRIAKLAKELEQAEGRIVKLAAQKSGDPGVASIYRSVQGLDGEEEHVDLKRELLETVFISNRQLLDMIASRRSASQAG